MKAHKRKTRTLQFKALWNDCSIWPLEIKWHTVELERINDARGDTIAINDLTNEHQLVIETKLLKKLLEE